MMAILQGKRSFTREIQVEKRKEHELVTKGIYACFRHPSYLGWFIWSAGTQVLLANPVSFMLYFVWGWPFLYRRIKLEENYLAEFLAGNTTLTA